MKPLTEEEQAKYLEEAKERFLYGGCAVLAYEIGKYLSEDHYLVYTTTGGTHAFVASPDMEWAVDINGVVEYDEMLEKYDCVFDDDDDEMQFFPNDEKGRAEFAEATDWFFETVGENVDRQLWYWGELLAEYVKYKTIPNYPWEN